MKNKPNLFRRACGL